MSKAQAGNAADAFDPAKAGAKAREDKFADAWPGDDPTPGAGVAGVVAGYESIPSTFDETRKLTILKLKHAVTLNVHPGTPGGALTLVGDVGVVVGAGLRGRVSDSALPVGSYVSLRFTGVDAEKRNMRTYDVYDVDKAYLLRLHEAAKMDKGTKPASQAGTASGRTKPAPAAFEEFPAAMDGDDDLPF